MSNSAIAANATKVAAIRNAMPAVTRHIYLNTGTYGPLPRPVHDAMKAVAEAELEDGRIVPDRYAVNADLKRQAREEIALLLGCSPHNIALTRHTTDGVNIGVLGVNWQPGDEIVTTDMEHPGGQAPIFTVARRYGVVVRTARLGNGGGDVLSAIARLITPRTRLVMLSHLTWNTGAILPIREIAELAHHHGALVVIDGAQSAGSIPINVIDLGVDVYAIPGQKWLCGPEGTGAVYISDDALDILQLTVAGFSSLAMPHGIEIIGGYLLPKPTAERFEVGGMTMPAIAGQAESLRWIRQEVGFEWAYERIRQLGQYAWHALNELQGVQVITPAHCMAGLISFTVDGCDPAALVQALWQEHNIIVRFINHPYCIRISTGFYNTEEDIDRLVEAIQQIRQQC